MWDFNLQELEYYDIMPRLVERWKEDKKRRHKIWNFSDGDGRDDTKMPETFEEFRRFVLSASHYMFWGKCEYEVIVHGWPPSVKEVEMSVPDDVHRLAETALDKEYRYWRDRGNRCKVIARGCEEKDEKIDVYDQIEANINVITKHFMDYINS